MIAVGVNGSGRGEKGNTAVLLGAVLKGIQEGGAKTTVLTLQRMRFAGCDGWEGCKETHRCAIKDDMDRFYELAPKADVLVLATPIYFDHITSQMKAFLDRLYCYVGRQMENYYPNKNARAIIGITYGADGEHTYDEILDWLQGRLKTYWGIPTIARFAVPSAGFEPLITPAHPVVREAYEFGKSLSGS